MLSLITMQDSFLQFKYFLFWSSKILTQTCSVTDSCKLVNPKTTTKSPEKQQEEEDSFEVPSRYKKLSIFL
jgi:peptide deformylase